MYGMLLVILQYDFNLPHPYLPLSQNSESEFLLGLTHESLNSDREPERIKPPIRNNHKDAKSIELDRDQSVGDIEKACPIHPAPSFAYRTRPVRSKRKQA